MEISGVSTPYNSSLVSSGARAETQSVDDPRAVDETRQDHGRPGNGQHGRTLGVFQHELRLALKAHFHARFAAMQENYAAVQEPATSDDVAEEALGAAKQMVAESPTKAANSLISFRAKVHETASYVRETVGVRGEVDEVSDVVATIDGGLSQIENEVAVNRESSASVLSLDTSTKQQSSIRIRTQEGDVVKLSLMHVDSLSATDVAFSDGDMSATSTRVELSGQSQLMLYVRGDLNESELAAIQNVFVQAESIADDFFGGDIAAAFSLAEGFEFDAEELAGVNMGFRMRQVTNVAYVESASTTPAYEPETVAAPVSDTETESDIPVIEAVATEQSAEAEPADVPAPVSAALPSFFEALSTFLRSVGEGFAAESSGGSFSYHYSESFKLELLNAVIHAVAPEESTDSAAVATSLIDSVNTPNNEGVT